jgi:WD40 repeat protein/transcriptional regulator with XRE-family HTH domain
MSNRARGFESPDFRGLFLMLRGRAGFTQRELAEQVGVSGRAVGAWEAGLSYPSARSLQRVIALFLARGAFAAGRERAEAGALWQAALDESPRLKAALDEAWFDDLLKGDQAPEAPGPTAAGSPAPRPPAEQIAPPAAAAAAPGRQDWGEAPSLDAFHGRAAELGLLSRWLTADCCRLVGLVGMGGIGKTALAARLAEDLAPEFEYVYWRSLRNLPPFAEWLGGAIRFLSDQRALPPEGEDAQQRQLLNLLRAHRCLLVLDNLDTVLEAGAPEPSYREGCEGYGLLLHALGETGHRSCLLLTSREQPPELGLAEGEHAQVRLLRLVGLDSAAGRALLAQKNLAGDAAAWDGLVGRYGGNALALQVVAETVGAVFGGDIAAFLAEGEAVFGGIRRLLGAQLARLSATERAVLFWLAVEREPVRFAELVADLGPAITRREGQEALEGLGRRSLVEQGEQRAGFTLQPVVLEHVTEELLAVAVEEIRRGQPALLVRHALVKATAKEYVRRSQERLLATPLLEQLVSTLGDAAAVERRLVGLLDDWRDRPRAEQGYGPGNVVNLLRLSRGHLRGLDLSRLSIRQAYLADCEAQDASLAGADLSKVAFAEAFGGTVSAALSADGAYLAAGAVTGQIRVWRLAQGAPVLTMAGQIGPVSAVALSGDGRLLASGGNDGSVRLWDTSGGECLFVLGGEAAGVWGVALSGDGRFAASGGLDGAVRLWETAGGRLMAVLEGHAAAVVSVALSGDGRLLASGGYDGTVRLWETTGGRCLAVLEGHTAAILTVALSADGRLAASGGFDGTVRLWDTAAGRGLAALAGHAGGVWAVALSADGRLAASGGFDGAVRLWDTAGGERVLVLEGHTAGVWGVALSGNGGLAASGGADGAVRLWETSTGRRLAVLEGHTAAVRAIALSGDGRLLASGGTDGPIRLWDAGSGDCTFILEGHTAGVGGMALSGDGRLLASGGMDGPILVWETGTGRRLALLEGHNAAVRGMALNGDGRLLASGGMDGTLRLWGTADGRLLAVLEGHTASVRSMALSGDGRLLASGGMDGAVRLWDTSGGECLFVLEGHAAAVRGVALSMDGRLLASGGNDGTVRLWDSAAGRSLAVLAGHAGGVWGVALSGDGRLAASGGFDGAVRVWDTAGGECLLVLEGHAAAVVSVALSEDGQLLASGGADGTLRLWETGSGAALRTLRPDRPYERLDITGLTGVTEAQRAALLALGAVERGA